MNVLHRLSAIALMVMLAASLATAQTAVPRSSGGSVADARRALAAGRAADALGVVEPLLAQAPGNQDLVNVAILAAVALKDNGRAYAAYDAFVQATGRQAATLLRPIAIQELRNVAANAVYDPRLRAEALERLGRGGDAGASDQLRQAVGQRGRRESLLADTALMRLGDQAASARIAQFASAQDNPDTVAVAEAIRRSGSRSQAPLLVPLLRHADPETRVAAVEALGVLGYIDAIAEIRLLVSDPYPAVRSRAALALARLGDSAGHEIVSAMLRSPAPEVRLLALDADPSIPAPERSAAIRAVIDDPDPLTRLKAAEALARDEPEAARPALLRLTEDPDMTPRREAARVLENLAPLDVALFRHLMADSNDWVRMYAAGGILNAAR
jgi:HEAT repeat protein